MRETPIWIQAFMNAVYGGYGELALASFNEEKALKDATEKIRSLERNLSASPAPVAKVSLSRKVVDGMGEAAVMAARMGGVPGEPIKTILEAWGIEVKDK